MTLEFGTLLINRYRIVDILGLGGMGSVYRAVDENLGISVAVKENLFLTDEYARQFRREASILASLRHPNLPRVGDHFVIQGQGQYLVMDYIEGEDLRQRLERAGVITEDEVIQIGMDVADALAYLHNRQPPVVHRDVKPGNIKITPEGHTYLVDFGLAKEMADSQVTSTGARAMTPGYSPPEQYGTARTDPRSDIYSLGATLYAALTGTIPEDGLARATGSASLTEIRKLDARVGRKLASVIERALSLKPEDRFQSAEEFRNALGEARGSSKRNTRERTGVSLPLPRVEGGTGGSKPKADQSSLLPVSTHNPVEQQAARPLSRPRTQPRKFRFPWLLLVAAVISVGALLAAERPELVGGLLALLPSHTATATLNAPQPSATARSVVFAPSKTPLPAPATATATLQPSQTPNPTVTPTSTIEPTPTAFGGSNGLIAFVSQRTGRPQIWLMNADGSNQTQLTDIQDGACQPDWSPDGQKIVFISPCLGKRTVYNGAGMYLINIDGTNLTPLPATPEGDFDPAWAPDGASIAFTSLRDKQAQIYAIRLSDNNITRLSSSGYSERQPAWSPDGAQLAFVRERVTSQVWLMDADGGNYTQFTLSGDLINSNPVWTPDGRLILYNQSKREQSLPWLTARRLEDAGTYNELPIPAEPDPEIGYLVLGNVSADGFWIVYENWFGMDSHDIFIMTITGANQVRLTTDPALDYMPAWSP